MTVYIPDDQWTPQLLYIESQLFYVSGQKLSISMYKWALSSQLSILGLETSQLLLTYFLITVTGGEKCSMKQLYI